MNFYIVRMWCVSRSYKMITKSQRAEWVDGLGDMCVWISVNKNTCCLQIEKDKCSCIGWYMYCSQLTFVMSLLLMFTLWGNDIWWLCRRTKTLFMEISVQKICCWPEKVIHYRAALLSSSLVTQASVWSCWERMVSSSMATQIIYLSI